MSLKKWLSDRRDYVYLVAPGKLPIPLRNLAAGQQAGDAVPYEQAVKVDGTETVTGAKTYTGNNTHSGTETFTGPTLLPNVTGIQAGVGIVSGSTLTSATTPAISATTSGTVYTLAAAAITVTLPPCSTANIGLRYKFVTTTIATAQVINTTGSDVFLGSVYSTLAVVNATNDTACGSSTANKTMTMNGTTTGGLPGSYIEVVCISATTWAVNGFVIGASGTQATLFSN